MSLPPLVYAAGSSVVIVSVVGFLMFRNLPGDLRVLSVLFGLHALTTVAQFVLAFQNINNIWTSHLYNVLEVGLLLWVFSLWTDSARAKRLLRIIIAVYTVIWLLAKIFIEQFNVSPIYTPTLSRVLLVVSSLYILSIISSQARGPLVREHRFWFATGFLLSCVGSLMFYGLRNLFNDLPYAEIVRIWSIHWVVIICYNTLFLLGFVWVRSARNTGGRLELAQ